MLNEQDVITALKQVHDPEIPVNIYDLGLIYDIQLQPENGQVDITMTFTSPSCPAADIILEELHKHLRAVEGVTEVNVTITFSPPYTTDLMSESAKLELGFI
jgi:FeS assembly SUF system protein